MMVDARVFRAGGELLRKARELLCRFVDGGFPFLRGGQIGSAENPCL
jgi:hypothetical protein